MNYKPDELPEISVIVPAFNAARTIQPCLEAILNQKCASVYEVIVVDNNSTDQTFSIASSYPSIKLIQEKRQGRANARNGGIRAARGKFLVFCDSDCVPQPNWLEALMAPFKDQGVGGVGGEILTDDPKTLIDHYYTAENYFSLKNALKSPYGLCPLAGNAAYRAEAVKKIGFFNENLTFASEDAEFALRIKQELGLRIEPAFNAVVYHQHRHSLASFWEQHFRYGVGIKHWEEIDKKSWSPYKTPLIVFLFYGIFYYALTSIKASFEAMRQRKKAVHLLLPLVEYLRELAFRCGYTFAPPYHIKENGPERSKVSIITICLNAENSIEASIQSVLSQTYPNIEYIIVDGQSKDATMGIVGKYKNNIAQVISEQDKGVYDAMNKGVQASSGDIIYFLNADDRFCANRVVEEIVKHFDHDQAAEIIYGKVVLTNVPKGKSDLNPKTFYSEIKDLRAFFNNGICQQRVFARREVFNKIGCFNVNYKILGDFDWLLRTYKNKIITKFLDMDIAYYNSQGLSFIYSKVSVYERRKIALMNLNFFQLFWFFDRFLCR